MSATPSKLLWHLCIKEARQVMPLVVMLSAIALAFHFCHFMGMVVAKESTLFAAVAFIGLPSLFAVGVGAMLVGQEKDLRTMLWLRAMPIRHEQIVLSKLIVGLLSLSLIWTISSLLFALNWYIGQSLPLSRNEDPPFYATTSIIVASINSLFLASAGMWLAWKLKSSFQSLAAIVPCAMVPWVAWLAVYELKLLSDQNPDLITPDLTAIILLVGGTIVCSILLWRDGLKSLGAADAPRTNATARLLSARRGMAVAWFQLVRPNPRQALTRQFAMQNRVLLATIGVTIAVCGSYVACALGFRNERSEVSILLIVCFIAISWLGVLSFHGDGFQQRIRFLADRGVSPWLVWRTRHSIPIIMLIGCSVICGVSFLISRSPIPSIQWIEDQVLQVFVVLAVCFLVVMIYAVSQWVGQLVRSPIVAAIIAPPVSFLIGSLVFQAFLQLDTPLWLIAIACTVPFIATSTMMKSWMDGRVNWGFLARHVGWMTLLAGLLVVSFVIENTFGERMPSHVEASLMKIREQQPLPSFPMAMEDPFVEVETIEQKQKGEPVRYEQFLNRVENTVYDQVQSFPIARYNTVEFVATDLAFERMAIEDQAEGAKDYSRYQQKFARALKGIEERHEGQRLFDLDNADALEVVLLAELRAPNAINSLGRELYHRSLERLADSARRDEARRRAIASEWYTINSRVFGLAETIGGYPIPTNSGVASFKGTILGKRARGVMLWHLLQVLEAKDDDSISKARKVVADDWHASNLLAEDITEPTLNAAYYRHSRPGAYWRGRWEQIAKEMLDDINKNSDEQSNDPELRRQP